MGRTRYGVRDEIKDTAETFYRAVTAKNLKAIESIWAQVPYAAVAGRSGQIRQGWPAVRGYWEERFGQLGAIKVVARLTDIVVHAVGDVAWVSGTELRTVSVDDDVRHERLRMTCVLERKGAQWQIVSYHASEGAARKEEAARIA
jgi:ketosteroid isomerase-like protein